MRVLVLFVLALIAVAVSAFDYKSALQELVDQQMIEDNAKSSVSFFESRKAEIMSTQTDLTVSGVYGLDFFAASSTATLTCFKNKGHTFLIPRGYRSIGALDPNVVSNIKNAWAVGFKYVDAYIFPCYKCGNGAGQVQTLVSKLRNEGAKFGMIWLDIEGAEYWSRDPSDNAAFFQSLLKGAATAGVTVGVYTNKNQWEPIMGSYTGGSKYPLWYAHYDKTANFNDFRAFGGWSKPAMKQYLGDVTVCETDVDVNVW